MRSIQESENYGLQELIAESNEKPLVVKFEASWCGPCRMLTPIVDEIANETPEVTFVAVDVDANPELSQAFNIRSIPTVLKIENGKVTESFMGARSKPDVKRALKV